MLHKLCEGMIIVLDLVTCFINFGLFLLFGFDVLFRVLVIEVEIICTFVKNGCTLFPFGTAYCVGVLTAHLRNY